jgi:fibronectin type 3 domain-containing protein/curli biogenesis system outer membrane secretion channel CsgG
MGRPRFPILHGLILLLALMSFFACASAPEVAQEEQLTLGSDERAMKGRIYVNPNTSRRFYRNVAMMPFQAPVELAGASISDLFATELLFAHKYNLVERSQMEQVLGEQALSLKGVTESAVAMRIGKLLNVQGVIVGTVPEYGSKASGKAELAAIGLNVRMIDVNDGSIVWSVSDTAISDRPTSLSAFANRMVRNLVGQLLQEMIRVGDTQLMNVPAPVVVSSRGKVRGAVIEIQTPSLDTIKSYKILRSRSETGPYREVADLEVTDPGRLRFEDRNLLDAETYYYRIYTVTKSNLTSYPTEPLKISTTGPSGTVAGLAARGGLVRRVVLTWSPASDANTEGYSILRKSGGGRWQKIKTLQGSMHGTYTDENLGEGATYNYRIVSFNAEGTESKPSASATATTKAPFSEVNTPEPETERSAVHGPDPSRAGVVPGPMSEPVRGLRASGEDKQIALQWEPHAERNIVRYEIYRDSEQSPAAKKIQDVPCNVHRFLDRDIEEGTKYHYRVIAIYGEGAEKQSSQTVLPFPGQRPSRPTGMKAAVEGNKIRLTWQSNGEEDIAKYVVEQKGSSVWDRIGETKNTGCLIEELEPGKIHAFRIIAVNRANLEGEPSEEIRVTIP